MIPASNTFLANPFFLIALTFMVFLGSQWLSRRIGLRLFNPILISIAVLIALLCGFGVDYEAYRAGGQYIEFWLKPAVVALGVPLYRQLSTIRKQVVPLLVAELAGCAAGLVSVVVIAEMLGATREVALSLAPKAVTTPIAIEISQSLGGIPALTAAVVVCTGIFGSIAGFKIVSLSRIKSPMATGLSIGTASHAVGTAAAMERSERYGAFSSLGLTLNGILTALLVPYILGLLGY
ncbi:MAG: LrgB family protein [Muribaculaceae bacterium]|nr:LrgB family protein [Muribaculaceae bacterium]